MSANVLNHLSWQALDAILLTRFECETLDFKRNLNLNLRHDQLELARDVLAMANMLGGYIVIGIEDKTFAVVGISEEEALASKMVRPSMTN